jgi:hypothetical protein
LTFGIGVEATGLACSVAHHICIIFYATSKTLIYGFLGAFQPGLKYNHELEYSSNVVEKAHLVWEAINRRRRFESPTYIICLVSMIGYLVVLVLIIIGAFIIHSSWAYLNAPQGKSNRKSTKEFVV